MPLNFDFRQLEDFQKKIERLQTNDISGLYTACANDLAARILRDVKKNTPTGDYSNLNITGKTGGALKKNWKATAAKKQGSMYVATVYNPTNYASYVEFGHRQKPGRFVPAIGKRLKKSWVPGKFMLTKAENRISEKMQGIINKKVQEYLQEHLDGN
jgi:hypothetical protein